MEPRPPVTPDPTDILRQATAARIGLGRSGASLPTREWLDFQAAHAAARDAVHVELDVDRITTAIEALGYDVVQCRSAAESRSDYLLQPELGRRLDDESRDRLAKLVGDRSKYDLAVIICDGLSASAIHQSAAPVLGHLLPKLAAEKWQVAPICVVRHGRVGLQDEIGSLLRAKLALTLIGERPGLAAANSMGAYLVYDPNVGNTDADRNCVSNIHEGGMTCEAAAQLLFQLLTEAKQQQLSGVQLKLPSSVPGMSNVQSLE